MNFHNSILKQYVVVVMIVDKMKIKDVKEIVEQIGNSIFIEDDEEITIKDYLQQNLNERNRFRKEESYEKFCYFAPNLLLRAEAGKIETSEGKKYISDILAEKLLSLDIDDKRWENSDFLHSLVKKSHFKIRFSNPSGKILKEAKEIFDDDYNREFNIYLEKANNFFMKYTNQQKVRNYFFCEFKNIYGVGFKTRDLGLSVYLDSVMAIDRHLKRVPHMLGMTQLSDLQIDIWNPDRNISNNDYPKIADFYIRIAYKLNITPYQFDRYFWNFASEICKKDTPNCNFCLIKKCPIRKSNF